MFTLANQFLIAMPGLPDRNFTRAVVYIVEHNNQGAMGITINRQLDLSIAELLSQMEIDSTVDRDQLTDPLYLGGPVQENRGFILHDGKLGGWSSSLQLGDRLCVTTSRDILEAMAAGKGPEQRLVALGYAGWAPGQLEREIAENSWLSADADNGIIFNLPPEQRWNAAAASIGVDPALITTRAGRA